MTSEEMDRAAHNILSTSSQRLTDHEEPDDWPKTLPYKTTECLSLLENEQLETTVIYRKKEPL